MTWDNFEIKIIGKINKVGDGRCLRYGDGLAGEKWVVCSKGLINKITFGYSNDK